MAPKLNPISFGGVGFLRARGVPANIMEVSFFEEFPTNQALANLNLIDFPTKIYIAAHSLKEFRELQNMVSRFIGIQIVYWIVLKKWEGYWISPFSARSALLRTLNEVREEPIEVMLDLENPVHAPWLYILELPNFWRNKRLISEFIEYSKSKVTLVELSGDERRLKFWGLVYETDTASVVKMVYTSLTKWSRDRTVLKLRKVCEDGVSRYGSRFKIGLGCIAKGISGLEPILSPENLAEDLRIAKEVGVREAIIFRLGGLAEGYIKAIKSI